MMGLRPGWIGIGIVTLMLTFNNRFKEKQEIAQNYAIILSINQQGISRDFFINIEKIRQFKTFKCTQQKTFFFLSFVSLN